MKFMVRRFSIITMLGLVALVIMPLSAHDDYRVIGVVTKVQATKLRQLKAAHGTTKLSLVILSKIW